MWNLAYRHVAIIVLVFTACSTAEAQRRGGQPPRVGDEVSVLHVGEWVDAVIVSSDDRRLTVRFHKRGNGDQTAQVVPAQVSFNGRLLFNATLSPGIAPAAKNRKPENNASSDEPAASTPAPMPKIRTWTDVTGKFKTEAIFVALADGKVELKRADGTTVKLPLDKLSLPDQAEAKKLARAAEAEDPFQASPESTTANAGNSAGTSGKNAEVKDFPLTPCDFKAARVVALNGPRQFAIPRSAADEPTYTISKQGIALKGSSSPVAFDPNSPIPKSIQEARANLGSFGDEPCGLMLHPGTPDALVFVTRNADPVHGSRQVRVERVDVSKGKVTEVYELAASFTPYGVSNDGTLVVGRMDQKSWARTEPSRVQVWEFKPQSKPRCVMTFAPYPESEQQALWKHGIAWLGDDHLVTTSNLGQLVVWEYPSLRPVYTVALGIQGQFTTDESGEYLAVNADQGIFVLEAISGKVLGQVSEPLPDSGTLAFNADASQLAFSSDVRLVTWDLTRGKKNHEVSYPRNLLPSSVNWASNDMVLVESSSGVLQSNLVDLKRKVVLWTYRGPKITGNFAGRQWGIIEDVASRQFGLAHWTVPHPAAQAKAANLGNDTAILKPGATVAISMNVNFGEPDATNVRNRLTKQLTDLGMTVVDQAPLTVECTAVAGTPKETSFRPFGRAGMNGQNVQTVSVTPTISSVTLKVNDEVLWRTYGSSATMPPGGVDQKALNDAVAKLNQPNADFLKSVTLPTNLVRHPKGGSFGFSTITPKGIVDN